MITYTIYVIDDERIIRDGISTSLSPPYRVLSFSTAEDALVSMSETPPCSSASARRRRSSP